MSALGELQRVVPPPDVQKRVAVDWPVVEGQLGTRLPPDYKDLVGRYGPGCFDGFLWVFGPATKNQALYLPTQAERGLRWLRELRGMRVSGFPYALFPEPGGVLPWGVTEYGDQCFWRTDSDDPSRWTVAVKEIRAPHWDWFPGKMTEWLLAVLTRQWRCAFFPPDWPSDHPTFVPLPD